MILIAMFVADIAYSIYQVFVPREHVDHFLVAVYVVRHVERVARGA